MTEIESDALKRAIDTYEAQSKSLQKIILIIIAFGLFFLFMIVLPYFSLKYDSNNSVIIDRAINSTRDNLLLVSSQFNKTQQNIKQYIDLQNNQTIASNNYTSVLLKLLHNITSTQNMNEQNMIQTKAIQEHILFQQCKNIPLTIQSKWLVCNAVFYLKPGNDRLNTTAKNIKNDVSIRIPILDNEVNETIGQLNIVIEKTNDFLQDIHNPSISLKEKLRSIHDSMHRLSLGPNSTITYQSVTAAVYNATQSISRNTGLATKTFDDFKKNYDREKGFVGITLKDSMNQLRSSLEQMQTPLGKIPIGFNQTMALFPIGITAAFAFFISVLYDTDQLRKSITKAYYKMFNKLSSNTEEKDTDKHSYFLQSLWLNPEDGWFYKIVQWTILWIPFSIFVVSVFLNFWVWYFMKENDGFPPFSGAISINESVYFILYIVCLVFFAISFWYIYFQYYRSLKEEKTEKSVEIREKLRKE